MSTLNKMFCGPDSGDSDTDPITEDDEVENEENPENGEDPEGDDNRGAFDHF